MFLLLKTETTTWEIAIDRDRSGERARTRLCVCVFVCGRMSVDVFVYGAVIMSYRCSLNLLSIVCANRLNMQGYGS